MANDSDHDVPWLFLDPEEADQDVISFVVHNGHICAPKLDNQGYMSCTMEEIFRKIPSPEEVMEAVNAGFSVPDGMLVLEEPNEPSIGNFLNESPAEHEDHEQEPESSADNAEEPNEPSIGSFLNESPAEHEDHEQEPESSADNAEASDQEGLDM